MRTSAGRGACSLVEMSVSVGLLSMLLCASQTVLVAATRNTTNTAAHDDAMRSVELALESIRTDLGRMVFVDVGSDLAILDNGHGFCVRIPVGSASDFWSVDCEPVAYFLRPRADDPRLKSLVRQTSKGAVTIGACTLEDLVVRVVSAGQISAARSFLEITAVGGRRSKTAPVFSTTSLVPLTLTPAPTPYILE